MKRNRKFILVSLISITMIFSFFVYKGIERDILKESMEKLEKFNHKHGHHHGHEGDYEHDKELHHENNQEHVPEHHHHKDQDDQGLAFYKLEILNHPWNNPNYRSNLFFQILTILFVDLVFLGFIFIVDKPKNFKEKKIKKEL